MKLMDRISLYEPERAADVAQNCILPYRGLAVRKPCQFKDASDWMAFCRMQFGDTAECNSALRRRASVSAEISVRFMASIHFNILEVFPLHEPERGQPCPRSWTLDVQRSSQKLPTFNFQRPTSNITPPPERCSCWFMAPTHVQILEVFPFHEPLRPPKAKGMREAFGVRPACRRFGTCEKAGASSPHSKRWRAYTTSSQFMAPMRLVLMLLTLLTASISTTRAQFTYETPEELFASGDFDGDLRKDVVIVDRASGLFRTGYQLGADTFTWANPHSSGMDNVAALALGRFVNPTRDMLALTAPEANRINLFDVASPSGNPLPIETYLPSTTALLQDFETVTPINYALSQLGAAPGPAVQVANAGSSGRYLRLIYDGINGNVNAVTFARTAPGLFQCIEAEFDFRITSFGQAADGFAFMLWRRRFANRGEQLACRHIERGAQRDPAFAHDGTECL